MVTKKEAYDFVKYIDDIKNDPSLLGAFNTYARKIVQLKTSYLEKTDVSKTKLDETFDYCARKGFIEPLQEYYVDPSTMQYHFLDEYWYEVTPSGHDFLNEFSEKGKHPVTNHFKRNHKNYILMLTFLGLIVAITIPIYNTYLTNSLTKDKGVSKDQLKGGTEDAKKTQIYYFTADLSPDKSRLRKAMCWTRANSSNRSDAYRCAYENRIFDPCFSYTADAEIIDCPTIWSDTGIEKFFAVYDKSIPPIGQNVETSFPWKIVLKKNSTNCRFITGVTAVLADDRINYGCDSGYLTGIPEDHDGIYSIKCKEHGINRLEICQISEIWY